MSAERSPATGRRYPLTQVCRVYRVPRSTVYDTAARTASPQGPPSAKRGPKTPASDETLVDGDSGRARGHAVPWRGPPQGAGAPATAWPSGEPHPRVAADAAPRPAGAPTGRASARGPGARRHHHPAAPNVLWGTDATRFYTAQEGWCWWFGAIDHASAELARREDRRPLGRPEPVHQGMRHAYGAFGKDVARGLALRSDWGPQYAADAFRNELTWLCITHTPSTRRRAPVNGVIERFIRP